jgi:hypothetical protein
MRGYRQRTFERTHLLDRYTQPLVAAAQDNSNALRSLKKCTLDARTRSDPRETEAMRGTTKPASVSRFHDEPLE